LAARDGRLGSGGGGKKRQLLAARPVAQPGTAFERVERDGPILRLHATVGGEGGHVTPCLGHVPLRRRGDEPDAGLRLTGRAIAGEQADAQEQRGPGVARVRRSLQPGERRLVPAFDVEPVREVELGAWIDGELDAAAAAAFEARLAGDAELRAARDSLQAGRDAGGDLVHEAAEQRAHQRQEDQQRDEDGDDLRRIDQGGFLNLGERLEQADHHAHHQAHDQHRRTELDRQPDRLAAQVEDFRAVHCR